MKISRNVLLYFPFFGEGAHLRTNVVVISTNVTLPNLNQKSLPCLQTSDVISYFGNCLKSSVFQE